MVKAEVVESLFNLHEFGRRQELSNVLHYDYFGFTVLHDAHEVIPELPPRVTETVLVEKRKPLTGRPPNHNVRTRDSLCSFLQQLDYVAAHTVPACRIKIDTIRLQRSDIEIVREYRDESTGINETLRHPAASGEQVDQPVPSVTAHHNCPQHRRKRLECT